MLKKNKWYETMTQKYGKDKMEHEFNVSDSQEKEEIKELEDYYFQDVRSM